MNVCTSFESVKTFLILLQYLYNYVCVHSMDVCILCAYLYTYECKDVCINFMYMLYTYYECKDVCINFMYM